MEVGDALDRIGEGLLLDLGVLRPDTVADGAIGSCSEAKNTYSTFEGRTVCQHEYIDFRTVTICSRRCSAIRFQTFGGADGLSSRPSKPCS